MKNHLSKTILSAAFILITWVVAAQCSSSFTWSQPSNNTGNFVSTSTGINSGTMYMWSFGDGNYAYSQNATNVYANAGVYTVCLTIYDSSACQSTFCDTVTITGTTQSCNASFTFSQFTANTGNFTSTSTGVNSGTMYLWYFGDGNYGYTQNATNVYANPGSYLVCLTIYDSSNCQSTFCDSIYISGSTQSCNANFVWSQMTNNTLNFTSTSTGVNAGTSYYWSFGDGGYAFTQNTQHQYANAGMYLVCLTISDSATGCQDTYCDTVSVLMGIHSYDHQEHWSVYPNPAQELLSFNTDLTMDGRTYVITDIAGRKVMDGTILGNAIPISVLEQGTYILQIKNSGSGFTTQRFIRN